MERAGIKMGKELDNSIHALIEYDYPGLLGVEAATSYWGLSTFPYDIPIFLVNDNAMGYDGYSVDSALAMLFVPDVNTKNIVSLSRHLSVTDPEQTVCDMVRYNRHEFHLYETLLNAYEGDVDIERLEQLAKQYDILDKMKQYNIEPKKLQKVFRKSFLKRETRSEENGKILHLDGDKRYSDKSIKCYKKLNLNAIVRNVPENRQEYVVFDLLNRYNPDVLVITGHDGMIKNGTGFNDIYNYRNSKYFINTVREAKKWVSKTGKDLVIFAGACQSYYEALVSAGANFASSPARVLIDFMDPLIVAEKVATTEDYKYITINDIADELRDGTRGISGIGARGKRYTKLQ